MRDVPVGLLVGCPRADCCREAPFRQLRSVRPSVTDLRFRGDACVQGGADGCLEVCLGNFSLAQFPGLPIDLPHLNNLVERLRQGRRRRPVS